MGGTAPRVKAAVQEAMGGCLFLDEAYALIDSNAGVATSGGCACRCDLDSCCDICAAMSWKVSENSVRIVPKVIEDIRLGFGNHWTEDMHR